MSLEQRNHSVLVSKSIHDAKSIHDQKIRAGNDFDQLRNVPQYLIEVALFGYVNEKLTSVASDYSGLIESADHSSLC